MPAFKIHKPSRLLQIAVGLVFAGILMLALYSPLVQAGVISGTADLVLVLNDDENTGTEKEDAGKEFYESGVDFFLDKISTFQFGHGSSVHYLVAQHSSLPGIAMDIPIPPPKIPPGL